MDSLQENINKIIAEKLVIESELESLRIDIISKGAENLHLNGINNTLKLEKQEIETSIIGLNKQVEILQIKSSELKQEIANFHAYLKEFDKLKLKLDKIRQDIDTEENIIKSLRLEKSKVDTELRIMQEEWGKLKRENDKFNGITAKLATAEYNESKIQNKIDELAVKSKEIEDQLQEVIKQKNEFITNPLSIGYYIKFLQKKVDTGKPFNVFDEIKRGT